MKFFVTIVSLFAAGVLSADAPECAQTCVTQSLSSSDCTSATDYACLCASQGFLDAALVCLQSTCDTDDAAAAQEWATATCAAAGVPVDF